MGGALAQAKNIPSVGTGETVNRSQKYLCRDYWYRIREVTIRTEQLTIFHS